MLTETAGCRPCLWPDCLPRAFKTLVDCLILESWTESNLPERKLFRMVMCWPGAEADLDKSRISNH